MTEGSRPSMTRTQYEPASEAPAPHDRPIASGFPSSTSNTWTSSRNDDSHAVSRPKRRLSTLNIVRIRSTGVSDSAAGSPPAPSTSMAKMLDATRSRGGVNDDIDTCPNAARYPQLSRVVHRLTGAGHVIVSIWLGKPRCQASQGKHVRAAEGVGRTGAPRVWRVTARA